MAIKRMERMAKVMALAACVWLGQAIPGRAQSGRPAPASLDQPDAQHTKDELNALFDHYPPALRNVLSLDPGLLSNETYLEPYPALGSFLKAHPEVARNPTFYVGEPSPHIRQDAAGQIMDMWRDAMNGLAIFAGFGLAIGLLVWLVRTLVDYRRWSRLSKVQTEVHTKLLDRFAANEDLITYIQSPAGAKFLQSSPISLDAGPRSVGAPMGRILWSVQGGVVLLAGGIGMRVISGTATEASAQQSLAAIGVLGIALGIGFLVSAIISFVISQRLGLIDSQAQTRTAMPGA